MAHLSSNRTRPKNHTNGDSLERQVAIIQLVVEDMVNIKLPEPICWE
nr:MAG TPA: hypothetical protein [Herelleviridae sp.]